MRRVALSVIAILMTLFGTTAHADVITDWNQTALEVLKTANMAGNPWSVRLQRQFTSLGQMAEEQRIVRIWGGIDFRNSLDVSDQMGRKIAAYLISNSMTPVR